MPGIVACERLAHLTVVPAQLAPGRPSRCILDTGIGVNLLRPEAGRDAGFRPSGRRHSGRRMSGQSVDVPMGELPQLEFGGDVWPEAPFGEVDAPALWGSLPRIDAFLSLGLFESRPLTLAARARRVLFGTADRRPLSSALAEVPLEIERDGPSVSAFVELDLPTGTTIRVEVDTGSESLILHTRYMAELDVAEDAPAVRRRQGTDETGRPYTRFSTEVAGAISLSSAPSVARPIGETVFQEIIYDGLVGTQFLDSFDVRFDLARGRVAFFEPLAPDRPSH